MIRKNECTISKSLFPTRKFLSSKNKRGGYSLSFLCGKVEFSFLFEMYIAECM